MTPELDRSAGRQGPTPEQVEKTHPKYMDHEKMTER
jgi:hypothetical protein